MLFEKARDDMIVAHGPFYCIVQGCLPNLESAIRTVPIQCPSKRRRDRSTDVTNNSNMISQLTQIQQLTIFPDYHNYHYRSHPVHLTSRGEHSFTVTNLAYGDSRGL